MVDRPGSGVFVPGTQEPSPGNACCGHAGTLEIL